MAEKKQFRHSNLAAGILGTVGFFCLLGSAGTEDCRDEMNYENERLGYEYYSDADLATPQQTRALTLFGIASMGGAAAILLRKQNQKTK